MNRFAAAEGGVQQLAAFWNRLFKPSTRSRAERFMFLFEQRFDMVGVLDSGSPIKHGLGQLMNSYPFFLYSSGDALRISFSGAFVEFDVENNDAFYEPGQDVARDFLTGRRIIAPLTALPLTNRLHQLPPRASVGIR